MSELKKAVRANLYSVHWQSSKEGGYFHSTYRVLALDVIDAIRQSKPERSSCEIQCSSVDMLAEGITILISPKVLTEAYGSSGYFNDDAWRKMLGVTEQESFNGRRDKEPRA